MIGKRPGNAMQTDIQPTGVGSGSRSEASSRALGHRVRTAPREAMAQLALAIGITAPLRQMTARQRALVAARTAALLVPVAQLATLLWVIWTRTGSVPFWDEWKMARLIERANSGALSLGDLWAFHNEHRPFLQRLIDIGLIDLTHWNRQSLMSFDVLVGLASTLLILTCVWTAFRSRAWWFALFVPTCLLMLSFGQSENWFWPWQLGFIGIGFGVVVCLRAALSESGTPTGWGRFALALLGALIATLSSAGGLVVWIAFLPSIWRMGYRKLAIWIGSGILVWVAYFVGFHRSFSETPSPRLLAEYALTYLGAPLGGHSIHLSELFGVAGIVLFVANLALYYRLKKTLSPLTAWISLGLYGLGMAAITTDGRTALGIPAALAYRYQVFTALWWMTILVTSALVVRQYAGLALAQHSAFSAWPSQTRALVVAYALALVLACGGSLLTSYAGLRDGIAFQEHLRSNEWCMIDYETASDSCIGVYDDLSERDLVLHAARYMRQHHLAIFSGE